MPNSGLMAGNGEFGKKLVKTLLTIHLRRMNSPRVPAPYTPVAWRESFMDEPPNLTSFHTLAPETIALYRNLQPGESSFHTDPVHGLCLVGRPPEGMNLETYCWLRASSGLLAHDEFTLIANPLRAPELCRRKEMATTGMTTSHAPATFLEKAERYAILMYGEGSPPHAFVRGLDVIATWAAIKIEEYNARHSCRESRWETMLRDAEAGLDRKNGEPEKDF